MARSLDLDWPRAWLHQGPTATHGGGDVREIDRTFAITPEDDLCILLDGARPGEIDMTVQVHPSWDNAIAPIRSPRNHPRKVDKVFYAPCDVIILNLEDAVAQRK